MPTKNNLLLLCLLAGCALARAQSNNYPVTPCGTTEVSPWLHWYSAHKDEWATERNGDTAWLYVAVTVHNVGSDIGAGYSSQTDIFRNMCELNQWFEPARIRFFLYPGEEIKQHKNTRWNRHDWDGGSEMIAQTRISNRLNCYVVDDPAGNCGYFWKEAIVLNRSCSGAGNTTWAHEAGHFFSLPHTFNGWESQNWDFSKPAPAKLGGYEVEKTDGSNCNKSGDYFCDTKPDYISNRWSCNDARQSTQLLLDPNGVAFRSDATLIMGYSADACQTRFTPEQINAMRANIQIQRAGYLQAAAPFVSAETPADSIVELIAPIDTQITQYNNVVLQWNKVPNAAYYHVQVSWEPNFPVLFYNEVLKGDVNTVKITKGIPNNRTIYWRVYAYGVSDLCQKQSVNTGVFKTRNFTSTSDVEKIAFFELAPNPVGSGLPVRLSVVTEEGMETVLSLSDAAGRQIYRQKQRLYSGDNQLDIATDHLDAGLYFVALQTPKGVLMKRLVVAD